MLADSFKNKRADHLSTVQIMLNLEEEPENDILIEELKKRKELDGFEEDVKEFERVKRAKAAIKLKEYYANRPLSWGMKLGCLFFPFLMHPPYGSLFTTIDSKGGRDYYPSEFYNRSGMKKAKKEFNLLSVIGVIMYALVFLYFYLRG